MTVTSSTTKRTAAAVTFSAQQRKERGTPQSNPSCAASTTSKVPRSQKKTESAVNSLSKLTYTPPTPPAKRIGYVSTRKPSTLRLHASRGTAAPRVLKVMKMKMKASGKAEKPRILHLGDGRRVEMNWLPYYLEAFDYTLLSLDEAQSRDDIVHRAFPNRE
ncbi:unnamed protein product [Somion occarium]|uniref:Uncharacterized protein n=1 Tax=Somion occarium TaxID=3059160 RepID=A0ABP1DVX5_9APHY